MAIAQLIRKNSFSISILVLGAAWIWFSAADSGQVTQGLTPAPQRGFLAPDFTLETLTGEQVRLSDFRGQAVLVNIWATWCPPCRAEMPAMQAVYDEYADQGFTILAVNLTRQDSLVNIRAFIDEYQLTFPVLLDIDGSVADAYRASSLPSSFFIDSDGVIQEVVYGGPMAEALLRTRVTALFTEQP